MEEKNLNDLIVVKQLPVIEERLKSLSEEIDKRVEQAKALTVTEDTVKEVKKVRAELNKEFKALETQRKSVKEKVLAPYNAFENIYKTCVSDKYKSADTELKDKIDQVESVQKRAAEEEVKSYFNEYLESKSIDFVTYGQANINVTLSRSMKSLKEEAKAFIDKIVDDLNLIDSQEYNDEILIEYKKNLNVSSAIVEVQSRHKELEQMKTAEGKETEPVTEPVKAEPLKAPKVEDNQVYELVFKVRGTKEKLKEVKEFLENGGYDYE